MKKQECWRHGKYSSNKWVTPVIIIDEEIQENEEGSKMARTNRKMMRWKMRQSWWHRQTRTWTAQWTGWQWQPVRQQMMVTTYLMKSQSAMRTTSFHETRIVRWRFQQSVRRLVKNHHVRTLSNRRHFVWWILWIFCPGQKALIKVSLRKDSGRLGGSNWLWKLHVNRKPT